MIRGKAALERRKIPEEKLPQNIDIMRYKGIHRASGSFFALRHKSVRSLRHRDKISDEVLPEIFVKAAIGRKVKKHMDNSALL